LGNAMPVHAGGINGVKIHSRNAVDKFLDI
jgi:hypothetical protein